MGMIDDHPQHHLLFTLAHHDRDDDDVNDDHDGQGCRGGDDGDDRDHDEMGAQNARSKSIFEMHASRL